MAFWFTVSMKKPCHDYINFSIFDTFLTQIALMQKVMQQLFNHSTFYWHLNLSVHESLYLLNGTLTKQEAQQLPRQPSYCVGNFDGLNIIESTMNNITQSTCVSRKHNVCPQCMHSSS